MVNLWLCVFFKAAWGRAKWVSNVLFGCLATASMWLLRNTQQACSKQGSQSSQGRDSRCGDLASKAEISADEDVLGVNAKHASWAAVASASRPQGDGKAVEVDPAGAAPLLGRSFAALLGPKKWTFVGERPFSSGVTFGSNTWICKREKE